MRFLIWLFLIILIAFRFFSTQPSYEQGDKIRISSKVISEPIQYSTSQYLKFAGLKIYLDKYPEINYGDRVVVEGVVREDKLEDVVLVKHEESKGLLYQLRQRLVSFYRKSLPEPHSSLIAGVTLGSKANIPVTFWDSLKKSGTAHVVVASGFNVTLVAGFLINFFILFIPRKKAVAFTLMGIWFYAVFAGFDAPIVRAAIMGSIAFGAVGLGRVYEAWRGLFLSALIMLLIWPGWLTDLGFILSFVATASLMLFQSRINKRLIKLPKIIREDFSTSLAAQIGVAPILFVTFGYFNILSPIINALVLWTIAPITIIGMIAGIIGLVYQPVGQLVLYLVYPMSLWFVSIVKLFS